MKKTISRLALFQVELYFIALRNAGRLAELFMSIAMSDSKIWTV